MIFFTSTTEKSMTQSRQSLSIKKRSYLTQKKHTLRIVRFHLLQMMTMRWWSTIRRCGQWRRYDSSDTMKMIMTIMLRWTTITMAMTTNTAELLFTVVRDVNTILKIKGHWFSTKSGSVNKTIRKGSEELQLCATIAKKVLKHQAQKSYIYSPAKVEYKQTKTINTFNSLRAIKIKPGYKHILLNLPR